MRDVVRGALATLLLPAVSTILLANTIYAKAPLVDLLDKDVAEHAEWSSVYPKTVWGYEGYVPIVRPWIIPRKIGDKLVFKSDVPGDKPSGTFWLGLLKWEHGLEGADNVEHCPDPEDPCLAISAGGKYQPRMGENSKTLGVWKSINIPFNSVLVWDGLPYGQGITHEEASGIGVKVSIRPEGDSEFHPFPRDVVREGRVHAARTGHVKPLDEYFGKTVDIMLAIDDNKSGWADYYALEEFAIYLASDYKKLCLDTSLLTTAANLTLGSLKIDTGITAKELLGDPWPVKVTTPEIKLKPGYPRVSMTQHGHEQAIHVELDFTKGTIEIDPTLTAAILAETTVPGSATVLLPLLDFQDVDLDIKIDLFAHPQVYQGKLLLSWSSDIHLSVDAEIFGEGFLEHNVRIKLKNLLDETVRAPETGILARLTNASAQMQDKLLRLAEDVAGFLPDEVRDAIEKAGALDLKATAFDGDEICLLLNNPEGNKLYNDDDGESGHRSNGKDTEPEADGGGGDGEVIDPRHGEELKAHLEFPRGKILVVAAHTTAVLPVQAVYDSGDQRLCIVSFEEQEPKLPADFSMDNGTHLLGPAPEQQTYFAEFKAAWRRAADRDTVEIKLVSNTGVTLDREDVIVGLMRED